MTNVYANYASHSELFTLRRQYHIILSFYLFYLLYKVGSGGQFQIKGKPGLNNITKERVKIFLRKKMKEPIQFQNSPYTRFIFLSVE